MKISIYYNGKIKNNFIKDGINEYLKRMNVKGWQIQVIESKKINKDMDIIMSEKGKLLNSEELLKIFKSAYNSDLKILVGPPEGFKEDVSKKKNVYSLSPLTFTSELTILILIEQLYRFYTIEKGKHYVR